MSIKWTWSEDGKSVTVGEKKYELAHVEDLKPHELEARWGRARFVYEVLMQAEAAFRMGVAEYGGAVERIQQLYDQKVEAADAIYLVTRDIGVFFEPAKIADEFDQDGAGLREFITDALGRLKARKA